MAELIFMGITNPHHPRTLRTTPTHAEIIFNISLHTGFVPDDLKIA